jgi:hypothetical protein
MALVLQHEVEQRTCPLGELRGGQGPSPKAVSVHRDREGHSIKGADASGGGGRQHSRQFTFEQLHPLRMRAELRPGLSRHRRLAANDQHGPKPLLECADPLRDGRGSYPKDGGALEPAFAHDGGQGSEERIVEQL